MHFIEHAKVSSERIPPWFKSDRCALVCIVVAPIFFLPLIADGENPIVFNMVVCKDDLLAESLPSSIGEKDLFPNDLVPKNPKN